MQKARSPLVRLCVALVAVLGFLAVAVPADAAINNASVVPSPSTSPTEDNFLESVSCVSASWCVSVGYFENGGFNQTLIQMWDGNSWSIQASPNTSSAEDNVLESVSCVSESWCVAVGSYDNGTAQTLILGWNGSSWSIQPSPNVSATETSELYSVSCLSASSCVAVGDHFDGNYLQTLVQTWDGSTWSIQTSANTSTTETNYLFSVSCLSASLCVAVGAFMTGGVNQPMAQIWNGSNWTIQVVPSSSLTENSFLEGVSCASTSWCVAVGAETINNQAAHQTMIQVWDGSNWSIQTSPNSSLTEDNYLWSVSCVSVSSCVAVGVYYVGNNTRTLVEVGDGSTWTIQSSPSPEPTDNNRLESVSCAADWNCVAVGSYRPSYYQTLVLSLTGPAPPTTTTTSAVGTDPVAPAFTG